MSKVNFILFYLWSIQDASPQTGIFSYLVVVYCMYNFKISSHSQMKSNSIILYLGTGVGLVGLWAPLSSKMCKVSISIKKVDKIHKHRVIVHTKVLDWVHNQNAVSGFGISCANWPMRNNSKSIWRTGLLNLPNTKFFGLIFRVPGYTWKSTIWLPDLSLVNKELVTVSCDLGIWKFEKCRRMEKKKTLLAKIQLCIKAICIF